MPPRRKISDLNKSLKYVKRENCVCDLCLYTFIRVDLQKCTICEYIREILCKCRGIHPSEQEILQCFGTEKFMV
jgi:hypothetical protein